MDPKELPYNNIQKIPTSKRTILIASVIVLTLIVITVIGFLLYRSVNIKKAITVLPPKQDDPRIACPVTSSECKDTQNYQNSALSAVLSSDTPLYAAFDGIIMGAKTIPVSSNDQSYSIIVLEDEEKTLQAEYAYIGEIPETRKVKKGEQIAIATENLISAPTAFNNKSFNFQMIKLKGEASGVMQLQSDIFRESN